MIQFYSAQDPWGVFSNFYLAEIKIGGKRYPNGALLPGTEVQPHRP